MLIVFSTQFVCVCVRACMHIAHVCVLKFHMLRSPEAATVNFHFLSVKMICSTFSHSNCQEKFLVQDLKIQS